MESEIEKECLGTVIPQWWRATDRSATMNKLAASTIVTDGALSDEFDFLFDIYTELER